MVYSFDNSFETYRYQAEGRVRNFRYYPCVTFHIPPMKFTSYEMDGWVMDFRQKTIHSRMYLHFYNGKGFGFRLRLPAKGYRSIDDIMNAISGDLAFSESEKGVVVVNHLSIKEMTFEDVLKKEQERIHQEIGDYSFESTPIESNVIDFSKYLKEPEEVVLGLSIAI